MKTKRFIPFLLATALIGLTSPCKAMDDDARIAKRDSILSQITGAIIPQEELTITDNEGNKVVYSVELAQTKEQRARTFPL